jgi:predicted RNA-binding protein with PIN domain
MLYLFDGSNILHTGSFADRTELVDRLAGFLALRGARGLVVFDGAGIDATIGSLEVRFADHADDLLERLAADRRGSEPVTVVSSDRAVRMTAGPQTRRVAAVLFLRELEEEEPPATAKPRSTIEGALDEATRRRLEELRRRRH